MELKTINLEAGELTGQHGVSQERATELIQKIESIVKVSMANGKGKAVVSVIFKDIANICNTTEELVFCCVSHCSYMVKEYGILYNIQL